MKNKHYKVAFFYPGFFYGGVEKAIANLANSMHHRGIDVSIVTINKESDFLDKNLEDSIPITYLNVPRKHRTVRSFPKIISYLRKNPVDVIIVNWWYMDILVILASKLASILSRRKRAKIVQTIHVSLAFMNYLDASNIKKVMFTISFFISLRMVDKILVVAQSIILGFSKKFHIPVQKFITIYNPIVSDTLLNQSKEPITEEWYSRIQHPIILHVARLAEEKNQILLLKAFKKVLEKQDADLLMLGDGEERQKLESFVRYLGIEQHVFMPGIVVNPYKFMRHADVFVLTSTTEGLPTVIVEALACGLPVVSTDCPQGPREILGNNKYGVLVPMNNPDALADAVLKMLKHPLPKEVFAQRAKDFTVEKATDQYLNLIEEVMQK